MMRHTRTLALAITLAVVTTLAPPALAQDRSQDRVRSRPRQITGWTVTAVSTVGLLSVRESCSGIEWGNRCIGETHWPAGQIALWSGGVALGTLLATVWSWTPGETESATLTVGPTLDGGWQARGRLTW